MKSIFLVTVVVLGLAPLRAEEMERPEPVGVAGFAAAPRIDGVLDDPVWSDATVLDSFVETWPGDNAPASRRTRVLLGSDARNLYLAVEAEDDPEAIRATLGRRDDVLADDHVRWLFDTFDDRRRAYVLALNPFGVAQDGLWVEGREVDYSFDFVFESKGRTNATGYALELALPFSSIRSASGPGHAWGLHVFRKIRHLGDTELSWRPLERGRARVLEQAGRIAGFVERAAPRRLEIIPSVTFSDNDGDGSEASSEASMGGTIRWALGRDLVVDAALRPDFAQVEADQPVVTANQRFPLFFAEKRPFFLEGTEVFATPLSVVNTRTIVDPEIALKASGRRGATTAGVLMARDRADSRDLAMVRVQREFDATTQWGLLATVMDAAAGDGAVLGFDLRANPDANTAWSVQVVGTQATRPFYDPDLDRSVVRSGSGWAYSLERKRSSRRRAFTLRGEGRSPDYVADLGFTRQVDLHRWSVDARYDAEPRSHGVLRATSFETTVLLQTDADGHPTYAYLYPQLDLKLARQSELQLFAYLDFLEIREHEFGARRSAERPGAFFGEPNRRTVYHGVAGQFTTAPTERLSLTLLVDRAWEVLDFDLGGGGRPRGLDALARDGDLSGLRGATDPGSEALPARRPAVRLGRARAHQLPQGLVPARAGSLTHRLRSVSETVSETLSARLRAVAEALEAIDADRGLLAQISQEERQRLLRAARQVSMPDNRARRRLVKATARQQRVAKVKESEGILSQTGIRALRRKPVFSTPNVYPPAAPGALPAEAEPEPEPEKNRRLRDSQHCYICKQHYVDVHHFYDQLCPACAEFNYRKRTELADLTGRVALLTGGRVKIGYQAGLKLLRCGARLIVTTRFPRDSAQRYSQEPDFAEWADRLQIYGLDLRHTPSVEAFCREILHTEKRLDFIVNNACQTVRRPPAFYEHMMAGETAALHELSDSQRRLLGAYEGLRGYRVLPEAEPTTAVALEQRLAAVGLTQAAELSQVALLPEDHPGEHDLFPTGRLDQDLQQVDLRGRNSWRLLLDEVSSVELLEVQLVNAVAPFLLNARLKPLMLRTPERDKHVVNVSAVEGQFYRNQKTTRHPHTNMAKAALNMMTRTSAADYQQDGIHMNSVDTGWVTDEDPAAIAERKTADHRFHPPLDIVDGAARIVDPIIEGANTGRHVWGKFLKDYQPTDW